MESSHCSPLEKKAEVPNPRFLFLTPFSNMEEKVARDIKQMSFPKRENFLEHPQGPNSLI
jgi:hypothetical protein